MQAQIKQIHLTVCDEVALQGGRHIVAAESISGLVSHRSIAKLVDTQSKAPHGAVLNEQPVGTIRRVNEIEALANSISRRSSNWCKRRRVRW